MSEAMGTWPATIPGAAREAAERWPDARTVPGSRWVSIDVLSDNERRISYEDSGD